MEGRVLGVVHENMKAMPSEDIEWVEKWAKWKKSSEEGSRSQDTKTESPAAASQGKQQGK